MIDEILRPPSLVGNRRVPDVDPQPVVERGDDFLIMAWAMVRHCLRRFFEPMTYPIHIPPLASQPHDTCGQWSRPPPKPVPTSERQRHAACSRFDRSPRHESRIHPVRAGVFTER